jgi:hypothetical protein
MRPRIGSPHTEFKSNAYFHGPSAFTKAIHGKLINGVGYSPIKHKIRREFCNALVVFAP